MAPETEKRKIRKFSIAIGFTILACGVLATINTSATAVLDGPGVSLRVDLPDGKLCGKSEPMTIRIDNALGETIEIGSLSASRNRLREEKNELNGEIKQVSEALPAADLGSPASKEVDGKLAVDASFPIPNEDGAYSDVFTLKWRRVGGEAWLYTDTFVKLEVTDGCAEIISDLEYESLTNVYSVIPFMRDGKEVLELAVEGGGTFDGYETPWAEIDDGVEPISTSSEKAVVIDGTQYQFIDPSYDLVSDNTIDEEFAGADGESAETASSGGGGMATDSVLALQYCVRVRYSQDAYQIPDVTPVGMRWWRPQVRIDNPAPEPDGFRQMNFLGLVVELWDRGATDSYITSATLNYTANGQYFCINFNWDQTAHPNDLFPDPYIKTHYVVKHANPRYGFLCEDSCSQCADRPEASWRAQYTLNLGQSSSVAYVTTYFTPDSTPTEGEVSATLSSQAIQMAYLQKFFETWDNYGMTGNIYAHWGEEGIPNTTSATCINLYRLYVDDDPTTDDVYWHRRWDAPAHEAGHAYQTQLLGASSPSTCPSIHKGYCSYNDHCATKEGWAEFVSVRTWYPDDVNESEPVMYTTIMAYGIEPGDHDLPESPFDSDPDRCGGYACDIAYEPQPAWHDCYSEIEIMVARSLWDMLDDNPDEYDELGDTMGWDYLADIWTLFPSGTGNHQNNEDDPYGNMFDYYYNTLPDARRGSVWAGMYNNSTYVQNPD